MSSGFDETLVQKLYNEGEKIQAIIYVRKQTGYNLKKCKDIVEIIGGGGIRNENDTIDHLPEIQGIDISYIKNLLQEKKKLEAIKHIMQTFHYNIQESKKIVDKIISDTQISTHQSSIESPQNLQTPIQYGSKQETGVKILLFIIFIIIIGTILWYMKLI